MKTGWFEIMLIMLGTVVLTLITVWAWGEFKIWRSNRAYGPNNRRGPKRGRRASD